MAPENVISTRRRDGVAERLERLLCASEHRFPLAAPPLEARARARQQEPEHLRQDQQRHGDVGDRYLRVVRIVVERRPGPLGARRGTRRPDRVGLLDELGREGLRSAVPV